ncbi:unnamed protein product [Allacma fusca]|uniref:Kinetochore protein NDC80 n=1 Tax=Allacma fusca TaxID=39272 RepID=A0A8J2P4C2_9HEXA|nr:unnamed protein product [Allacma fusca]
MDHKSKRKSVLAQHAALAGVSFDTRGPELPKPDTQRLNALPELTTPAGRPANGPASQTRSRIPGVVRAPSSAQSSSVQPRLGQGSQLGSKSTSTTNLHRTMTRLPGKPTVFKSTMRRSMSMESFGPMSANRSAFTTPLNRGPSPGSKLSTAVRSTSSKIIKFPNDKDKPAIMPIIELIITNLRELNYGRELTPGVFRSLSGKDLQSILVFLISYLLGPNEGKNKKDDITYIFDGLNQLNCPASLSKSVLKTLNTNHTLPQVYTVIAWLCCTIANFEGTESHNCTIKRNLAFELGQNFYEQISWEFYIRIFNQISRYDCESNTEVELRDFRSQLENELRIEPHISLSELEEEIEEKKRSLGAALALEDPRAGVMQTLKNQGEMSKNSLRRIDDLKDKLQKLTDLTAIETEITVVKSELARRRKHLLNMKKYVEQQQITKEKANSIFNEIANIRKQQELLKKITMELEQKLNKEELFLQNNMTRFYEVCSKFAIVETYNNAAKMWEGKLPQVDANPFDIDKMENWVNEPKTKLGNALGYLNKEVTRYRDNLRTTERTLADLDLQLDSLQEELESKSNKLSLHLHDQLSKSDQVQFEIQSAQKKLQATEGVVRVLLEEQTTFKADFQGLVANKEEWEKYLEDLAQYNTELEEKVEHQYAAHFAAETEIKCDLQAFVIEARAQVYAPITELDDTNSQP